MFAQPRFRLQRVQLIRRPLPEVFAFFADAGNLQAITPDFLNFHIVTPLPIAMREGALIDYRMALCGVRFGWRTRIESWEPPAAATDRPARFTDRQVRGPYALWHHTHEFQAVDGGTRMTDTVDYELRFGPAGHVAHALFVRPALARIFDHRRRRITELLAPPFDAAAAAVAAAEQVAVREYERGLAREASRREDGGGLDFS